MDMDSVVDPFNAAASTYLSLPHLTYTYDIFFETTSTLRISSLMYRPNLTAVSQPQSHLGYNRFTKKHYLGLKNNNIILQLIL